MKNRERNKELACWIGAAVSWLALILAAVQDSLGLELPRFLGGLLAGCGGALGGLLTVKALFAGRRSGRRRTSATGRSGALPPTGPCSPPPPSSSSSGSSCW